MTALDNIAAADSEMPWPSRTVADGQRTLGFLFDNPDGSFTAVGPDDEPLGTHPNRETARRAILDHADGRR